MAGQNGLGYYYYHGLGCILDKSLAEYWCSEAAKQNCPEACYHLGLMYGQGDGVQVDYSKARKFVGIAAKSGRIPEAESLYQQILEQGLGL
jgi:TPR repeat protein